MRACCLPGGHIILDRSIIQFAKSPKNDDQCELAFILAHESAHILLGHTRERLQREFMVRAGVSFIKVGSLVGALASGVALGITASLVESAYSRDAEFEADLLAMHILRRATIDPRGGIQTFQRLKADHQDIVNVPILKYFASHPPLQERIDRLERVLAEGASHDAKRPSSEK